MTNTNRSTLEKKLTKTLCFGLLLTIISIIGITYGYLDKTNIEVSSSDSILIYSFIVFLIAIVITGIGIGKLITKDRKKATAFSNVIPLAQAALFAALAYIGFSYFRIDIPIGPGSTAFHFGNTFVVVAALLLGGSYGGLSGAVGLSLADLTSGKYFTTAPQTFFLKLCIGLITGFIAHKLLKIRQQKDQRKLFLSSILAAASGLVFNIFADPIVGFFYKKYILSLQMDLAIQWTKMTAVTTLVNSITSILASVILYNALRPALAKANLLQR